MMIKVWETNFDFTVNADDPPGESFQDKDAPFNAALTKLILLSGVLVDDFDDEPVIKVMKENGILTLFNFMCLTPTLIDTLGYHPYGKWRPLSVLARHCLKVLLGLYHHTSHELQKPIHLYLVSQATYDDYHLNIYDLEADWAPWYKRDPLPNHPGQPSNETLGELSDESKLKNAIMRLFKGNHFNYEDNLVLQSFNQDRIMKWSTFVRMTYMDIDNLEFTNKKGRLCHFYPDRGRCSRCLFHFTMIHATRSRGI